MKYDGIVEIHFEWLWSDIGRCYLRRPDPISCRKWDVSYFMTLKKKKKLIFMLHKLQFIPKIH